MQLSNLLNRVSEPQTIMMAKLGRELKAKGIRVVDLSLGEPDFQTPSHIVAAATKAMEEGYTKYTPVAGYPELRQAIADKLKRDNNLDYSPQEILVSTGAKQVLANSVLSILNPGDEAIVPTPYWVTYASLVTLAEAVPVFIPCSVEEEYKLSPEKLEAAITTKTRLLIFSSPCNPTGAVYSKAELKGLVEVLLRYPDVVVISDEIYEYINYKSKHESIAQFAKLRDRVVVVNGFSKGYAMTGWRLGYMAAHIELIQACEKLQSQFTSGANSIAQRAAIVALKDQGTATKEMVASFEKRKDFVVASFKKIEGIRIIEPQGAFYAFPDVSAFFGKSDGITKVNNADELTMYLLNKAHVIGVSGTAFGAPNGIRFSFATSMDQLEEGLERITKALTELK